MAKLVLSDLTSGYLNIPLINANWALIEAALENTLSRDGTSPNTMLAALDMNTNRIVNLASPTSSLDAARLIDVQSAVGVSIAPSQTGNANKVLKTDGSVAAWTFDLSGGYTIAFALGTESAPSIYFEGDTNTGIYCPTADEIGFITGGRDALRVRGTVNSNNYLTIVAATNSADPELAVDTGSVGSNVGMYLRAKGSGSIIIPGTGGMNLIGGGPILNAGAVSGALLTTTQGLAFPATQNPSGNVNTLDDYEEGSWTPVLTVVGSVGNLNVAYSQQAGRYLKLGNRVLVQFTVATSTFTWTTTTGSVTLTGLPFTSANISSKLDTGACSWSGVTKANYTQIVAYVGVSSTGILFSCSGSGQGATVLLIGDCPTGGTVVLYGSLWYEATA